MPSAVPALYEPLIARDLDGARKAIAAFRQEQSAEELYQAIARFAVLAYAPSQHAKHAVLAALAAWDLREELGPRWDELIAEVALYAASSRQPWSEPPVMAPPAADPAGPAGIGELRAAIEARDRLRAEQWLARRVDDPSLGQELIAVAASDAGDSGDGLLVTDAALRLIPILGEKGRYVCLRLAVWELVARGTAHAGGQQEVDPAGLLNRLLARCIGEEGSLESARAVFLFAAAFRRGVLPMVAGELEAPAAAAIDPAPGPDQIPIYALGRDLGSVLQAHAVSRQLGPEFPDVRFGPFLAAVHHHLETAPSLEDWSFA